jgi:hypothetical protein
MVPVCGYVLSFCDSVFFFYVFPMFGCVHLSLGGITKGSRRMRLLGKFVENECEKIDRLMEFYTRYICCGDRRFALPFRSLGCTLILCCAGIQTE